LQRCHHPTPRVDHVDDRHSDDGDTDIDDR
jgi:hypothetical protein